MLAGVNGAGKSSVLGAALRQAGGDYFNPDEFVSRAGSPALAWEIGRRGLERAIAERLDHAFETTLGGSTITRMLVEAARAGFDVGVLYAGLESPALHRARVAARVARGGHDIPGEKIDERFDASRRNLVRLLPHLTRLRVFDNSAEADPASGLAPEPLEILRIADGRLVHLTPLESVPRWARPIVAAASRLDAGQPQRQE